MNDGPVLVLHVPAGGGHRAAALAIEETARSRGIPATVVDALSLAPPIFARAYVGTHLFGSAETPTLYGASFVLSNHRDPVREQFRKALDHAVGKKLVELVRTMKPRAIVCTHFYPLVELGQLRRQGLLDCPLVAVVTDYVTHAVWCVEGTDVVCTAPGRAADDARRHGLHGARLVETGIPVREAFGRVPSFAPPREGEPLRVLVTSGGFGVGPVRKVLRSFRGAADIEIDVVCGNRPELVRRASRLAARKGLDALVTGFANDMPDRMARAHVVVGKPGGLTMTECLAAGRPLVAVGTVPGQESANEDALVRWRAGMRSTPERVGPRIVAARGALGSMAAAAREHSIPDAAARVLAALA
jgi:processive 1,2-diacylglycerol beta-glucosyltransferase